MSSTASSSASRRRWPGPALALLGTALLLGLALARPRTPWPDRWVLSLSRHGLRISRITSLDVNIWPPLHRLPLGLAAGGQHFGQGGGQLWIVYLTTPSWLLPVVAALLLAAALILTSAIVQRLRRARHRPILAKQ